MKKNQSFSFWGFIISALILVLFAVQNAQEVAFKFMVWRTHLSLSVLLIVAFLLGVIAGAVFAFRKNRLPDESKDVSNKKQEKESSTLPSWDQDIEQDEKKSDSL